MVDEMKAKPCVVGDTTAGVTRGTARRRVTIARTSSVSLFVGALLATLIGAWGASSPLDGLPTEAPTTYSNIMMRASPDYTRALKNIDANIAIGWTGEDIVAATVTAQPAGHCHPFGVARE